MIEVGRGRLRLGLSPLGARITSLRLRRADARWQEITAGLVDDAAFAGSDRNQGATIGRVANRIRDGRFELDGTTHRLPVNDRGHTLHGGPDGFSRRTWTVVETSPDHAELALVSPDGDQGFPGTLRVRARFEVEDLTLRTSYDAATDAPTVVSLTSHPYFALTSRVADHDLQVAADRYLPTDDSGIPTGIEPVAGTAYDLRTAVSVDPHVDHCWVLRGEQAMRPVARLEGGDLWVEVATDQPGLQVYGGAGLVAGVALEPQQLPDAVHHPEWPSIVLRPGETCRWRSEITVGER